MMPIMPAIPKQPADDKIGGTRTALRRKVQMAGQVLINRRTAIACTVRDLSSRGAKVEVATVVGIPDAFELRVDGQTRPCRVVWRRLKQLGVAFTKRH
jgi:hypothetical protein